MTRRPERSRDAGYFDRLYAADPDPWNFAGSDYEREKYDATIAALGGRHFCSGFEIGCSIGVLTARLAARCEALFAIDLAARALARAADRCAHLPHVAFARRRVPEDWPRARTFDLIVLSEVLYFLTPADVARVAGLAGASLAPDGLIILVNFTGRIDEPCGGEEAASLFIAAAAGAAALRPIYQHRAARFRLDLLRRAAEAEAKGAASGAFDGGFTAR